MKIPPVKQDLQDMCSEFDVWITPSLGEIRDTERFRAEMEVVVEVFEIMGSATKNFADVQDCNPRTLASLFVQVLAGDTFEDARRKLQAFASVLFLVSGKSDNNAKCQLPIWLRNKEVTDLPVLKQTKKVSRIVNESIGRELTADKYMTIVANLSVYYGGQNGLLQPGNQYQCEKLLEEFIRFVLNDDRYVSQLWSVGRSYFTLKNFKRERDLLSPLIVFQVRGSVSASGGHNPEELLRKRLAEWGLQADVDYNTNDALLSTLPSGIVPVEGEEANKVKKKTRAYDFILPFRTPGWSPKIFIQSQFYAGDAGSVSHKNVDQTDKSRSEVLSLLPDARFIEYVDGAGYFSSLNGDLRNLLSKETTTSFIQVRSAAIRLRRELQQIGFLTPLELEHGIIRADGNYESVHFILINEGYSESEIQRCFENCIQRGLLVMENNGLVSLVENRRGIVRRYFLLDVVAQSGKPPDSSEDKLTGSLVVPGYGPFYGIKLDSLVAEALRLAPSLRSEWSNPEIIMSDIRWLCDEGLAMSR